MRRIVAAKALRMMDVDAALIHPPDWDPNAAGLAFNAARDFPSRFAILGSFALDLPDKRPLVVRT